MVRHQRSFIDMTFPLNSRLLLLKGLGLILFFVSTVVSAQLISGERVDVTTGREAPEEIDISQEERIRERLQPFGFNLFADGFQSERESGLNPETAWHESG